MVDDEWAAAGGGAMREEGITNMADDSILLRDEVRRIVLNIFGFSDEFGEKGDERILV